MKLVYIPYGNIPSKWAHTFNVMKMSKALSHSIDSFEVLLQRHWLRRLINGVNLMDWYGLSTLPPVKYIYRSGIKYLKAYYFVYDSSFEARALSYVRTIDQVVVYTRSEDFAVVCCAENIPVILETHIDQTNPKWASLDHLSRDSGSLLALITIHSFLKSAYQELGFEESKVHVLPDAVDPEDFDLLAEEYTYKALGKYPNERTKIVYTGHLYDHKGVDLIPALARELPQCNFYLFGGWKSDISTFRERHLGADLNNVFLNPFVPNRYIPGILRWADVLLLPNKRDSTEANYTSPMKLFEYLYSGQPVVATDIPAFDGLLRHNDNALLFGGSNVSECAAAILSALDSKTRDHLKRQSISTAERHTWKQRANYVRDEIIIPYQHQMKMSR